MRMLVLLGALVTASLVALLLTSALSRKGKHHVIYQVEGDRNSAGGNASAQDYPWAYTTVDGTATSTVRLPWKLHYYAPAGTPVSLSAKYQDDSPNGWLEARIYVDGQLIQSARSSGNETATVSGTVP